MNAPANFPTHEARHLAASQAVATASAKYAAQVEATGGKWTENLAFARIQLDNAIIDLIDDGNALEDRDCVMDEFRLDEAGNPVADEPGLFDPSLVHPDNPCQRGWRA